MQKKFYIWPLKCHDPCSQIWSHYYQLVTFTLPFFTDENSSPFSKILVISRLNGFLEFFELGGRLSHENVAENSQNNVLLPSMRKKTNLNPSAWKTIMNNLPNDPIPCHSCRAHTKTISVLATCKDLVISGSFDNLLKVTDTIL